ncbi:adenylate/guanylate cyclase domain-containing protein [Candidatus Dojkabacteria bacterium]|nr:adenylate/guanylate cyclase domain-containing protein [Candidatus Dojkabacteria bacterium]
MRNILRKITPYLYNFIILSFCSLILAIPTFDELNNIFLDRLQGSMEVREEIVIIGIDDVTLSKIGAWPWDRQVFAQAVDELNRVRPSVVGFDVLFLEEREGDTKLRSSLKNADFPIVMGSKIVNKELFESRFSTENISSGYTNFVTDKDGKIRKTTIATKVDDKCIYSFAFEILKRYLGIRGDIGCGEEINLAGNLEYRKELLFNYSDSEYSYYSFVDLYEGKIDKNNLEGKIILIGATPIDLKSGLLDNFTDVFGKTTPGVVIHANIVNSFLEDNFRRDIGKKLFYPSIILFCTLLLFLYTKFKRNIFEVISFFSSLILLNTLGIILHNEGFNWPFIQANGLPIISYVFFVAYKYFVVTREKRFLSKAFGKYIHPRLLKELVEHPQKLKLGGEKKKITVLFSDIQGYTTISEKLSPSQLLKMLNLYFDTLTNVLIEHNGTIDKYMGDAIMAFWNAPVEDKNHQINAIRAALGMKQKLKEFNETHPEYPEINCGIGINTDTMIVGNMGSKKRYSYTLIGDGVNLGSRIEGLTRMYKVNIIVTEEVLKGIDLQNTDFLPRLLDEVIVKGKKESVKIFEILEKTKKNRNLISIYEQAFKLYQKGEFYEAQKYFKKLKFDNPSRIMLDRINEVSQQEGWKGVWEWKVK